MAAQSKIAAAPSSPEQSPSHKADNLALPDDVSSIGDPEFSSTPPESFVTAPESPTAIETPTTMAPINAETAKHAIKTLIFDQGNTAAVAAGPSNPPRSTSPPLRLSAAMAEESLDPTAAPHRSYTVAQLVNIINKKKIQLPVDNEELDPRVSGFDGRARVRPSDAEIIEEVRIKKAEKAKMEAEAAAAKTAEVEIDPEMTPTKRKHKKRSKSKGKGKGKCDDGLKVSQPSDAEVTGESTKARAEMTEEEKVNKHVRKMAVAKIVAREAMRKETAARKAGLPVPVTEPAKPKKHFIELPRYKGKKLSELTDAEALENIKEFENEVKEGKYASMDQVRMASSMASNVASNAWSVNDRAKKMGMDPAKTINHKAGKGKMVYPADHGGVGLVDEPTEKKEGLNASASHK